jgi:dipeptidase E
LNGRLGARNSAVQDQLPRGGGSDVVSRWQRGAARGLLDAMRLLLTSGGVTNESIRSALLDMLGRPIAECDALLIPTAQWGHPQCGPTSVRGFLSGIAPWGGMAQLGWRSLGVLELTALPSIGADRWEPWVRDADVLLVDGGDAAYLAHWLRASGLADVLAALPDMVWVGVSAGSMVMTPRVGAEFVHWPDAPDDKALGVVDFSIFPHLDVFPSNTMAAAEEWASEVGGPAYVIDDQTAIRVDGGRVEVISEGRWEQLAP